MKILIAEDDVISRRLLKTVLEKRGFEVHAASDGAEAWGVLQKPDSPQLAILDWMMPEMDGPEIIQHLRQCKNKPFTYVLLLTAKNQSEDVARGLKSGADDYLTKPFNPKELEARVNVGLRMIGLHNQLEDQINHLQELDRLKSEFISMVSHELRTPLAVMHGGVSLCLDGIAGELNDTQKDLLHDTLENIDQLTRMITDLLDISKIEAGKIALHRNVTDIGEIARKSQKNLAQKAREKNIILKSDIPDKTLSLYADRDKLMQIFSNLISNAIRYTGEKGEIWIRIEEKGDEYLCCVKDTGIGISADNMKRLFSKFEQFGRTEGPGYKGTGLGLAICKGFVEKHGGRIWAESELGKGSIFHFTVKKTGMPTVLIVDDEKNVVDVVQRFLSGGEYRFLQAYSGEEACKIAAKEKPSVILLDLIMPGMDGYEVITRLKSQEETKNIPIMIISASRIDQEKLNLNENSIPVLSKPIVPDALIASVKQMLD